MKFDFVIGNPPYNDDFGIGENDSFAAPVYHKFLDAAYQVADKVEMIHPARFYLMQVARLKHGIKKF